MKLLTVVSLICLKTGVCLSIPERVSALKRQTLMMCRVSQGSCIKEMGRTCSCPSCPQSSAQLWVMDAVGASPAPAVMPQQRATSCWHLSHWHGAEIEVCMWEISTTSDASIHQETWQASWNSGEQRINEWAMHWQWLVTWMDGWTDKMERLHRVKCMKGKVK